ncbi:CysS/YqeB C-terminal domain-containing protein [Streptosporangium jomthongense]|uniref:Cysteine--tRNA ligase n=1 Tax=Streptosporangium jomthongense TaxID=1193683 RepID=A0ABV8FEW4_9ACTN
MLRLYDTRHRRVEPVLPQGARSMRVYGCGPAAGRVTSLGDLRAGLLADLVRRVVERRGVRVVRCLGLTDLGRPPAGHGAEGRGRRDAFEAEALALNIHPPQHSPEVSETVGPVIEMIARLVERGHAYPASDGSVLFDATSFPSYGELSGNRLERLRPRAGEAGPRKRHPADWVLWRPTEEEPAWRAPWGRGVPGRHIGCSAMALRSLGERIDLHVGGIDLCFPHHENERAQSDAVTGHEVVAHWAHSGHLLFDGHELDGRAGGAPALGEVTRAGLDPLAVRLALLEHRHRGRLDLTWQALRVADATLRRWRSRVAGWAEAPSRPMPSGPVSAIEDAFDDDLDTPLALRLLRGLERDEAVAPGARLEAFLHLDRVLGLDLSCGIGRSENLPPGAAELLQRRPRAREAGDWAAADRLRAELAGLGVLVRDTPEGQDWSVRPS